MVTSYVNSETIVVGLRKQLRVFVAGSAEIIIFYILTKPFTVWEDGLSAVMLAADQAYPVVVHGPG